MNMDTDRRRFIVLAAAGAMGPLTLAGSARAEDEKGSGEEEVSPAEDLMREHGVLKRVILVYREGLRRLDRNEELPPKALADAAKLIRDFIEDYHEKLEEDHLFPRFRKAGKLVDLVDVLLQQHRAGRQLTDTTMRLSTLQALKSPDDRRTLADSLRQFIRMYEPHEAREDTVLFPALGRIVTRNEYDALGEDFEKKEHELFGKDGFEVMVEKVASIEKVLGIYDLSQFTPRCQAKP
jgi:hemerythrin-like domain-containing protein